MKLFIAIFTFISSQVLASSFSMIYIINGDASLTYYVGKEKFDGGLNALNSAKFIGTNCKNCEIVIFHLSAKNKDKAYLYHDGKLMKETSYSRKKTGHDFDFESSWYLEHSKDSGEQVLAFFGHELPLQKTKYFDSSKLSYSRDQFIEDMRKFLKKGRFSLTVLSTCKNAEESQKKDYENLTERLIGSTVNLNLRMIETKELAYFESDWDETSKKIVDNSFDEIAKIDETEIGLVAYDLRFDMSPYLRYRKNKFFK